jgi:hypothetical protein
MKINELIIETAAWQKKSGKNKNGGLNKKGVKSYRKEHPGSKLQTAVTKKPSEIKKGSKDAKRRKSFCARMKGMKKHNTSAKTKRDPDSRINKSLRKWHCESVEELQQLLVIAEAKIKQRLDKSCWTGYHKAGTKIKGDTRVNNCVKNEGGNAQAAAIAIAKRESGKYNKDGKRIKEDQGKTVHRIALTVTDPNHPMVSKRDETIQRTVRVPGEDPAKAINAAIAHYRRKGFKVHDHHYIGTIEESSTPGNDTEHNVNNFVKKFTPWIAEQLGIEKLPKIVLLDKPVDTTFGQYDPNTRSIRLVTTGRHPIDVLRTLAHELTHYKQDSEGNLPAGAGETGTPQENEANANAGVVMRGFAENNPEYFGLK